MHHNSLSKSHYDVIPRLQVLAARVSASQPRFFSWSRSQGERGKYCLPFEGCIKKVINSGYCFLQGRKYALLVGTGPPPWPATASHTNDLCAPSSPVSFPVLFLSRVSCLPILHKANRPDSRKTILAPYPTLANSLKTSSYILIQSVYLSCVGVYPCPASSQGKLIVMLLLQVTSDASLKMSRREKGKKNQMLFSERNTLFFV